MDLHMGVWGLNYVCFTQWTLIQYTQHAQYGSMVIRVSRHCMSEAWIMCVLRNKYEFFNMHSICIPCAGLILEQECIPVGWVPPAAVAITGSLHTHTPGTSPPRPGTPPPETRHTPPPPRTAFLTHACENITLPQTSFAGGNYTGSRLQLKDAKETTHCKQELVLTEVLTLLSMIVMCRNLLIVSRCSL